MISSKFLFAACMFIPFLTLTAQQNGVYFQNNLSWDQIKIKAKEENKYIFVDCYTSWCAPCKRMMKNVFSSDTIGKIMTEDFVSLSLQLDTTKNDGLEVEKAYTDAHYIADNFAIKAYPTFLFFSPDGKIVHRIEGEYTIGDFISILHDALDPDKQFYSLLDSFQKDQTNEATLVKLVEASFKAGYDSVGISNADRYFNSIQNPFELEKLKLLINITKTSTSQSFRFFVKNAIRIDSIFGDNTAEHLINNILFAEEIEPQFKLPTVDWEKIERRVANKCSPSMSKWIIQKEKVYYFQITKDWQHYQSALMTYLKNYGKQTSHILINEYIWYIFEHTTDENVLRQFLPWSKLSLTDKGKDQIAAYDTYANLYYKLGNIKKAIFWENKGIQIAIATNNSVEREELTETAQKMRSNQKTWD